MRAGTIVSLAAIIAAASLAALEDGAGTAYAQSDTKAKHDAAALDTAKKEPVYAALPGDGKKCRINDEIYFTYQFAKKPKMGTTVLIVRIFEKGGARVTNLVVTGDSDMPSMRGAHASGDIPLKLNKKKDYLLPVNIVMPGEWEVRLRFLRGDDTIYRGAFRFKV